MAQGRYSTIGYSSQRIGTAPKSGVFSYSSFDKGVNVFSEHNEIRDDEFYEGINIMIIGKGSIQMPRFGSENLITKYGATKFNGGGILPKKDTQNQLLILMFDGRLYRYDGSNLVEIDNTKTFSNNLKIYGAVHRDQFYFCNGVDPLSKTDGYTIVKFNQVDNPTLITVTKTGTKNEAIYTYGVTIVTNHGETAVLEADPVWNANTLDVNNKNTITTPRRNESDIVGYNFYRGKNGGTLTFIQFVPQPQSGTDIVLEDTGFQESLVYEAPFINTTAGVRGTIFATFKDTLFVAGVSGAEDIVFYTGTGEGYESFSSELNGGWVRVGASDGTKITGMIGFDTYLLIIKEKSIYRFDFAQSGAPVITPAIEGYGSSYSNSIKKFENDVIFVGSDNKIRTTGYEPRLLNVIRTTDISNRIQPVLDTEFDFSNPEKIIGIYYDQKYIVCDGNIAVCYDRRYLGFHGNKWTNFNYSGFFVYRDNNKKEWLLGVKDNGEINKLLVNEVYSDNKAIIKCSFRPKTIDGSEDKIPKFFRFYKLKIKNTIGSFKLQTWIDGVTIEDERTVYFGGLTGLSNFMWGESMWGDTPEGEVSSQNFIGSLIIITKEIYKEAYFIYPRIELNGSDENRLVLQSISGVFDYEDIYYYKDEKVISTWFFMLKIVK